MTDTKHLRALEQPERPSSNGQSEPQEPDRFNVPITATTTLPATTLAHVHTLLRKRAELVSQHKAQIGAIDTQLNLLFEVAAAGAGFDMTLLQVKSCDAPTGEITLVPKPEQPS